MQSFLHGYRKLTKIYVKKDFVNGRREAKSVEEESQLLYEGQSEIIIYIQCIGSNK